MLSTGTVVKLDFGLEVQIQHIHPDLSVFKRHLKRHFFNFSFYETISPLYLLTMYAAFVAACTVYDCQNLSFYIRPTLHYIIMHAESEKGQNTQINCPARIKKLYVYAYRTADYGCV